MTTAVAFLIFAAAIALLATPATVGIMVARGRFLPGPSLVSKTLVVHTRRPDNQSVRGILVAQHADRLILREAVYLDPAGEVAADGLVHVPSIAISSVQELSPAAG